MVVEIDRGDYWQCAYVVPKGRPTRSGPKASTRSARTSRAPRRNFADAVEALQDWDQVKLLSVSLDRLRCWWRPGLLAIGDAAHAMSPVGGVGINLAVQDAVAAANILAGPLASGQNVDPLLKKVQQRRLFPTRVIQVGAKDGARPRADPVGDSPGRAGEGAASAALVQLFPFLRRIPARLVGLGIRREHIRSPDAGLRRLTGS